MMIPFPDVTSLPEDLAQAVCRLVRLLNQMHRRHPELDRFAIWADDALERRAVLLVASHIERLALGFDLVPAPCPPHEMPQGAFVPTQEG